MSDISQAVAIKAMDGLMLRQTAIAQNIANSGSEGYAKHTVSFENALREAAEEGLDAINSLTFSIEREGYTLPGEELRLDLEMQSASSTGRRFAALADLLGRQIQISRTAIKGGQ